MRKYKYKYCSGGALPSLVGGLAGRTLDWTVCLVVTMEPKIPENSSSGPSHPGQQQEEEKEPPNKYQNISLHSLDHFNSNM